MSAVTGHFPPSQHDGTVTGPYHNGIVTGHYHQDTVTGQYHLDTATGQYRQDTATGQYRQDTATGQYHHRHALESSASRRRSMPIWAVIGIVVIAVVVLVGVGAAVTIALRTPTAPAGTDPIAAKGAPVAVKLGETLSFRAGKTAANYALTAGRPLTLTPSGSRPSRGTFLGLEATVTVVSGSVYLTDDNFILVTTDGRKFEPDVSFLFEGGLRGARAGTGQTATGLVVWDLPEGAQTGAKVELRIEDSGLQGTWQLP
jgi:hypothetical protein